MIKYNTMIIFFREIKNMFEIFEGRETITVTKKTGEECLTIKTIKHPDGREERIESNECPQMKQFSSTLKQYNGDSLIDKWLRF